jgi:hypothetical protein
VIYDVAVLIGIIIVPIRTTVFHHDKYELNVIFDRCCSLVKIMKNFVFLFNS